MTFQARPIGFKPGRMKGLTPRLIASHYENNYGGALRRLNVRLSDGNDTVAFPIPLPAPPAPKAPDPRTRIEADVARDGGTAHINADGSVTATFPAPVG